MRSLVSGAWFMHRQSASAYLPMVAKLIQGESVFEEEEADTRHLLKVVSLAGVVELGGDESLNDIELQEDSIVVVPIIDAIVKYDMPCGPVGMLTRAAQVREANENPNVKAIVFLFDTPGGEAGATEVMERAIKESTKDTYGLVQGLMCSAGMWIGSACDKLYISSETDIVGSIGTMITLANYEGYFKKEGIELHDIYADDSKDKNQDYHQALKGNYKPIKQNLLNPLNAVFKATIIRNRPDLNQKTTLTGRTFIGSASIDQGLVDGKTNLETLIKEIMFGSEFKSLKKFQGKKKLSAAETKALEKELAKLNIKGVKLQITTPAALLMESASEDEASIYVYAEEGEDPTGKQCVYADEAGQPTDQNLEDGDHALADGRVLTSSIGEDGLSYVDAITNGEEEAEQEEEEEEEDEKPTGKSKIVAKKKIVAKAASKGLSMEGRMIMAAIKEELEEFKGEFDELKNSISSGGVPITETNGQTRGSAKSKDGLTAIQRRQKEIQAEYKAKKKK